MRKKVLITYTLHPEPLQELMQNYDVTMPESGTMKREEVLELIADYEVLVPNFGFYTDQEMMDKGVKLELISNYGVGFNNIDVDYATKKGIAVTNTPRSTCEPTAELAFALLIGAARRIGFYDRKLREERGIDWSNYGDAGLSLWNKTLGIIGMGRIGRAVARRAIASGMNIVYHNRNRVSEEIEAKYGARYVSLEELLKTSDFVSLNAPSTPETWKMMGTKEFELMKESAIFTNTARGNMVDEDALIDALKHNKIWAAGLDVYENEPKIHPGFMTLDNVLLAPHAGTKTVEDRNKMAEEMAQNIIGFYEDKYTVARVN